MFIHALNTPLPRGRERVFIHPVEPLQQSAEWRVFTLPDELDDDDDADAPAAAREVVRDLLDHLGKRLRVEDFPDQERRESAVEEAQAAVGLSAVFLVAEGHACEVSTVWVRAKVGGGVGYRSRCSR